MKSLNLLYLNCDKIFSECSELGASTCIHGFISKLNCNIKILKNFEIIFKMKQLFKKEYE